MGNPLPVSEADNQQPTTNNTPERVVPWAICCPWSTTTADNRQRPRTPTSNPERGHPVTAGTRMTAAAELRNRLDYGHSGSRLPPCRRSCDRRDALSPEPGALHTRAAHRGTLRRPLLSAWARRHRQKAMNTSGPRKTRSVTS